MMRLQELLHILQVHTQILSDRGSSRDIHVFMRRDFSPVLEKLLKLCIDLHQQTKLPAGMSLPDAPH